MDIKQIDSGIFDQRLFEGHHICRTLFVPFAYPVEARWLFNMITSSSPN